MAAIVMYLTTQKKLKLYYFSFLNLIAFSLYLLFERLVNCDVGNGIPLILAFQVPYGLSCPLPLKDQREIVLTYKRAHVLV